MSVIAFNDPCILFALSRESAAFRREFRPHQRFLGAPCRARFCGPAWLSVLVVETGMGRAATENALAWLLHEPMLENVVYRPKLVLSAGFIGALDPGLDVGDIVLATEIVDGEGNRYPATWPTALEGEWQPPLRRGRVVTMPKMVTSSHQKAELAKQHQATAVDMEAAIIARACVRKEIPFGCVRAVSDRADASLSPRLASLFRNGSISLAWVLAACVRWPRLVPELWRLARDTRRAGRQLGKALGELLTLTLPGNEE